jgi:hypothetical protein
MRRQRLRCRRENGHRFDPVVEVEIADDPKMIEIAPQGPRDNLQTLLAEGFI